MVFECTLDLGTTHPVREARNEEEFIENLIAEYNSQCDGLFDIRREDISNIRDVL